MYRFNDLAGKRFGRLTVIEQRGRTHDRRILWECACDCGNKTVSTSRDLISGHTKSCGCLQKEATKANRHKHGDREARLYSVWKTMKKRCETKNANHTVGMVQRVFPSAKSGKIIGLSKSGRLKMATIQSLQKAFALLTE